MRANRRRDRWFPYVVIAVLLVTLAAGTINNVVRNPQPRLVSDGRPGGSALTADSSLSSNDLLHGALTDLDGLTLPNGATLAGWNGPWRYVWPRDASFVAAARCAVGQYSQARDVLSFLDRVRPAAGRWEARYTESGERVADGREPQLDSSGWVIWAAWFCRVGDRYWELVRESADQIVAELGRDGLPAASPDYWERTEKTPTLGTVAPLLTGLRSAVAIATQLGRSDDAVRWRTALERLSAATDRSFGPEYPRTPARAVGFVESGVQPVGTGGGRDAIVTVLGPPFAPARPVVSTAIERAHAVLTQPNGGVTPGEDWRTDGVSWTPETALFALSAAARGDQATARRLLAWLADHRTRSGALPEKVNRDLEAAGEAPLAWTASLVVLTDAALRGSLPIPG
ncbi:glucoamylase [Kribbella sp. NPDC048915]|uniref:glucoamylase n=1 Tax=Kribbella sp. NPDC048915 TaxID=3155148 RepID=UPI0033F3137F